MSSVIGIATIDTPQVCVVVKVYAAHAYSLPVLLAGIFSGFETRSHMRAVVLNTDDAAPYVGLIELIDRINLLIGFQGVILSPRSSADVRSAFPELVIDDYGYLATVGRVLPQLL
jgi:hypothetical protein